MHSFQLFILTIERSFFYVINRIERRILTLEILGRAEGTIHNHKYAIKLSIEFMDKNYQIYDLESIKPIHLKQLILYWKNEKKGHIGQ